MQHVVLSKGTVLVVEDSHDIGDLVVEILADEGFVTSVVDDTSGESIRAAVARIEPDCILLDGEGPLGYGSSWEHATWATRRDRRVPVIMFTGHTDAVREARGNTSARSRDAGFAGALAKPFRLDDLIEEVSRAVQQGHAPPA